MNGDAAAHFFNVLAHNIHADAASGILRHFLVGRKARKHNHLEDFFVGVFAFRLGQKAVFTRFCQNLFRVKPAAVVGYVNVNFTAHIARRQRHFTHSGFALFHTLVRMLDGVVHRVADHVHKRIGNGVIDGFIHLCVAAERNKLCLLIKLFGHITHNTRHFLERAVQRHHADAHHDILQFVGQLAQLAD